MPADSRQLVTAALEFTSPRRVPRHMWLLPWAERRYPEQTELLQERFPSDITWADDVYDIPVEKRGDPYAVGTYVDEWECEFVNVHGGIVGEVKQPKLRDVADWRSIRPPYDVLPHDELAARDRVNRFCAESDLFVLSGCGPRPWERYQFLRGTADAMVDLTSPERGAAELLRAIHEFYLKEVEFWTGTDVDGIFFQDDWGSQNSLLISPSSWRELFKPLYRDYCDLAHAAGKFAFMHSDGNITAIYEDLIEAGVDAINSQLFCMDMTDVAQRAKGKITFWGEIDRQHVLASPDPQVGRDAVQKVARHLWDATGGVIAQFSFELAGVPETAMAVFDEWERIGREHNCGCGTMIDVKRG